MMHAYEMTPTVPAHILQAAPLPSETELELAERALRHKLLFRLLNRFDFDAPDHQYEAITDPVASEATSWDEDHFEFH
ncbi:MAG: hypothetical protein AAGP08_01790 [Pseudomonadota bacterium]